MGKEERRGFALTIRFAHTGHEFTTDYLDLLKSRLSVYDPFQKAKHIPLSEVQGVIADFQYTGITVSQF